MISDGIKLELHHSVNFHQSGVALLISPSVLRGRGAGQVDLCKIHQNVIICAEVKCTPAIHHKQAGRLRKAFQVLTSYFPLPLKYRLLTRPTSQMRDTISS